MKILFVLIVVVLHAFLGASQADDCSGIWNGDQQLNRSSSVAIRLTLLHHQHPCSPIRHPTRTDLPLTWHRSRTLDRERMLASRLFFRRRRRASATNVSVPVTIDAAGASYGFVAQIGLGTPPTMQSVLIDSAASFSWVQCKPCGDGCYEQDGPLMDVLASTTYRRVPCSSPLCLSASAATMAHTDCSPGYNGACLYRITYMDRSASKGCLSTDTLTVGEESFPEFVFGCSRRHEGAFGRYAGIFGFAIGRLSFFSQVVEKAHQYRAFSYYLPSPSSVGYIQVGRYDEGGLSFTPMLTAGHDYYLILTGITVDGCSLDLADDGQGQPSSAATTDDAHLYLDLGSALSILPRRVHARLSDAVAERMRGYDRVRSWPGCFDPAYLSTERAVPAVEMHLKGGARLVLDEDKLMYKRPDGRQCLGFVPGSFFLLGSMQLQMIYVAQDVERSRMGFSNEQYE
ncbi:hypothetical protein E2562_010523 [Oryza meyeriana var. granulata]|uniref:Peptidase A1 domain-containing protein n=1 Tax=Oryza meyeriana var. granulata TaxID=110450 RepID=A0A6G1DWU7_9ORYZ|nr:hypothetical protein E2562_010523 [Oryza meyeriana var. granulata]KAF0916673.1 hypothetical protein E2562_010523 [Oryza meyeriana var. granulata]